MWQQQHISKKLEQVHVSYCVASPLPSTTICKHLGAEGNRSVDLWERNVVPLYFKRFQLVKGLDWAAWW